MIYRVNMWRTIVTRGFNWNIFILVEIDADTNFTKQLTTKSKGNYKKMKTVLTASVWNFWLIDWLLYGTSAQKG